MIQAPDPTGLPGRIQPAGQCVRLLVKVVIVLGFVDSNTPDHDGRATPIPLNHGCQLVFGNFLPCLVSDILPARNFLEN